MSFIIIPDACIACGGCVQECPNAAIEPAGFAYRITDACTRCGTCFEVCPTGAIVED